MDYRSGLCRRHSRHGCSRHGTRRRIAVRLLRGFDDDPVEEVWSNNVARCTAELLTDGGERPAVDIEITLYDFSLVKEGKGKEDDYIPPDYSIHVTGSPNVFTKAVGF